MEGLGNGKERGYAIEKNVLQGSKKLQEKRRRDFIYSEPETENTLRC